MAESPFATAEWFQTVLDHPETSKRWLAGLGVREPERGYRDLRDLAARTKDTRLAARLVGHLHGLLPPCPDPDMALTNLERFISAFRRPAAALKLLAENSRTCEILVQLFSTSQHFSELMIREPDLLEWLRSGADRRDRETLFGDLWSELVSARGEDDE